MVIPSNKRSLSKKIFVTAIIIIGQISAFGQRFEIGGGVGATHYKGEIYPSFKLFAPNVGANAFVRVNLIRSGISMKATGMIGNLSADDRRVNSLFHQERGLKFTTSIWEVGGQLEYNFLHFRSAHARNSDWTPYVFGGFAQYTVSRSRYEVNSDAFRQLVSYNAQKPKPRSDNAIPFGIGVKKMLLPRMNLTVEFGSRKILSNNRSDTNIDNIGYDYNVLSDAFVPNFIGDATANFPELRRIATPNNRTEDMYFYTNISISYLFGDVICPPGYRVPLFKRLF